VYFITALKFLFCCDATVVVAWIVITIITVTVTVTVHNFCTRDTTTLFGGFFLALGFGKMFFAERLMTLRTEYLYLYYCRIRIQLWLLIIEETSTTTRSFFFFFCSTCCVHDNAIIIILRIVFDVVDVHHVIHEGSIYCTTVNNNAIVVDVVVVIVFRWVVGIVVVTTTGIKIMKNGTKWTCYFIAIVVHGTLCDHCFVEKILPK